MRKRRAEIEAMRERDKAIIAKNLRTGTNRNLGPGTERRSISMTETIVGETAAETEEAGMIIIAIGEEDPETETDGEVRATIDEEEAATEIEEDTRSLKRIPISRSENKSKG